MEAGLTKGSWQHTGETASLLSYWGIGVKLQRGVSVNIKG